MGDANVSDVHRMSDNVLILGAGFSVDAGIPLISGFVDRMWELAIRKRINGKALSPGDIEVLIEAMKVRSELNEYHGRAAFDDRNIEDILSILSFNEMIPTRRKSRLSTITKAIGRTIELSCSVTHSGVDGNRGEAITTGPEVYRSFWRTLLGLDRQIIPTIITFNYDLVLERSLLQLAIGMTYGGHKAPAPAPHIRVQHHLDGYRAQTYAFHNVLYGYDRHQPGTMLKPVDLPTGTDVLELEILKLHGSLNFPSTRSKAAKDPTLDLARAVDDPFILPPIFNKQSTAQQRTVWRVAMERLRTAKNVIIVGYSLPRTDIYMQYFLKAAFGPNIDLNRVIVFDPALYQGEQAGNAMMLRYAECFAPQLQNRIRFRPDQLGAVAPPSLRPGTTEHFVYALQHARSALLFGCE